MKKLLFAIAIDVCISISNHFKLKKIMDDQQQAAQDVQAITAKLKKIGAESSTSLQKITALEEAAANQSNLSPELKNAIAEAKEQAQIVDDLVADSTAGTGDTSGSTGAV